MAISIQEKTCTKCGVEKTLGEFHRMRQSSDGLHPRCKDCRADDARRRYTNWGPGQRKKHRERVLRCRYGIEMEHVELLFEQQGGRCAICQTPGLFPTSVDKGRPGPRPKTLCIDHDHETGDVRGLLCLNCNSALGKFGESTDVLMRALSYLLNQGGQ